MGSQAKSTASTGVLGVDDCLEWYHLLYREKAYYLLPDKTNDNKRVVSVGRLPENQVLIDKVSSKFFHVELEPSTGKLKLRITSRHLGVYLIRKGQEKTEGNGTFLKLGEKVEDKTIEEVFVAAEKATDERKHKYLETTVSVGDSVFFKDAGEQPHWLEVGVYKVEKHRSKEDWVRLILAERRKHEEIENEIDELNKELHRRLAKRRKRDAHYDDTALEQEISKLRAKIDDDKRRFEQEEDEERKANHGEMNRLMDLQQKYVEEHEKIQTSIRRYTYATCPHERPQYHPEEAKKIAQSGKHTVEAGGQDSLEDQFVNPGQEENDDWQAQVTALNAGRQLSAEDVDDSNAEQEDDEILDEDDEDSEEMKMKQAVKKQPGINEDEEEDDLLADEEE